MMTMVTTNPSIRWLIGFARTKLIKPHQETRSQLSADADHDASLICTPFSVRNLRFDEFAE
jgi:hypothetical protein